jgi:hypothetical protein
VTAEQNQVAIPDGLLFLGDRERRLEDAVRDIIQYESALTPNEAEEIKVFGEDFGARIMNEKYLFHYPLDSHEVIGLVRNLQKFNNFAPDFEPPCAAAYAQVLELLNLTALEASVLMPDRIQPEDGGVLISWNRGERRFVVSVRNDGKIFAARFGLAEVPLDDREVIVSEFISTLKSYGMTYLKYL